MPGGDVRRRRGVDGVDPAQQTSVEHRQLVAFGERGSGEVGHVAVREHVHLDRPAGGERHERGPVLAGQDDPVPGLLAGQDVGEQGRPVGVEGGDHALAARCDVGVGVDLAVRVVQGDADRLAAVLEREHLLDPGQLRERVGALRPGFDHGAGTGDREAAERALGGRAETDDLAAADRGADAAQADRGQVVETGGGVGIAQQRSERGRLVLEHGHVVVARHLRRVLRRRGGQRVEVRRRQEDPVLAGRGDRHPFPAQRVLAHPGRRGARIELAQVGGPLRGKRGARVIEVDEVAAVRESVAVTDDAGVGDEVFCIHGTNHDNKFAYQKPEVSD